MSRRELFELVKITFEAGYRCGADDEYDRLDDPVSFFRSEFDDALDRAKKIMGDMT